MQTRWECEADVNDMGVGTRYERDGSGGQMRTTWEWGPDANEMGEGGRCERERY